MNPRNSSENGTSNPFQEIAALATDAVYVHRDGEILWANAAAERMFGVTAECPLVGVCAGDLIAPQDRDRGSLACGGSVTRQRLDGTPFPSEANATAIEWENGPATYVLIRDLSETSEHELELAEVPAREVDFAEISPDAMLIHLHGEIVFVNRAACQMFGADTADQLIGRNVLDLVHPEAHRYIQSNWAATAAGVGDELVEMRRVRLDGTTFIGEARHRFVSWRGRQGILVVIRDATSRIETQHALQHSEERLRALLENLPDAVIAHTFGEIVYFNQAAMRLFGATAPEELLGIDIRDLTHPDDLPTLLDNWERRANSEVPQHLTFRRRRLDGTAFLGEVFTIGSSWDDRPGNLIVMRDVTERENAARRLRDSEARHRTITQIIPEALFVHKAGEIIFVNPAAAKIVGRDDPHELAGSQIFDLIHPEDRLMFSRLDRTLEFGQRMPMVELSFIGEDGTPVQCEMVECGYSWDNSAANLLVVRDVTRRKRTESRLRAARQEAEKANETKSRFFAGVSHELRSPLNAILGFSETIAQEMYGPAGNERYVTYAEYIHRSGKHLLSLIDDLLDLSKDDAGEYKLNESRFDLVAAVEETIRMTAPLASRSSVDLSLEKAPESLSIEASEREIRQILMNLLSNAVKFTPEGGCIEVGIAADTHTGIRISVADTGIGIAPDEIPLLFEAYRQAESTRGMSDQKGTGLGLVLSKRFAELHGGDIELESAVGTGTTATLILPQSRQISDGLAA